MKIMHRYCRSKVRVFPVIGQLMLLYAYHEEIGVTSGLYKIRMPIDGQQDGTTQTSRRLYSITLTSFPRFISSWRAVVCKVPYAESVLLEKGTSPFVASTMASSLYGDTGFFQNLKIDIPIRKCAERICLMVSEGLARNIDSPLNGEFSTATLI